MKRGNSSRKRMLRFCAEVLPEDGVPPREWLKAGRSGKKSKRKAQQLCSQVAEVLDAVLAGDCGDEVLRDLQVVAVAPAPDVSRLLVTVRPHPPADAVSPARVLDHLERASGRLRCEVAAAVTRKRAPRLAYRVELPTVDEAKE
jgi:ribosome-binding factor A